MIFFICFQKLTHFRYFCVMYPLSRVAALSRNSREENVNLQFNRLKLFEKSNTAGGLYPVCG